MTSFKDWDGIAVTASRIVPRIRPKQEKRTARAWSVDPSAPLAQVPVMLIFLNGFPGTGKLTIGQALMDRLGGRLLDVHTQMNIAYALTEFKSEAFYDTVRAIWKITDGLIADLPADTPLILTDALREGSDWSREAWARIEALAESHGPLYVVHVHCDPDENVRRIGSAGREAMAKSRKRALALQYHEEGQLLMGGDADRVLSLDTTELTADECAEAIADWIVTKAAPAE
ncbi:AAA family ATPase [uncultured Maritimibacter sp.]|uniref:AAA family ATPase n=1 Tax=uncultured Maritimibacter sp. TaxID=991866 RepID=UPI002602F0AF|nr:AAA family ATPase [uncultured Maritimibacter sp.]